MIGAMPSDGSSSSTTRGLAASVRATASICCSPPLIALAGRSSIDARFGNSAQQVGFAEASGHRTRDQPQVLGDGEVGEDAAILGHVPEPAPCARVRWQRAHVLAVEQHLPAHARAESHGRPQQRCLAGAVAPDERHDLAGRDGQVDVEQDLRVAVERRDAPQFQRGIPRVRAPRAAVALMRHPRGRRGAPPDRRARLRERRRRRGAPPTARARAAQIRTRRPCCAR